LVSPDGGFWDGFFSVLVCLQQGCWHVCGVREKLGSTSCTSSGFTGSQVVFALECVVGGLSCILSLLSLLCCAVYTWLTPFWCVHPPLAFLVPAADIVLALLPQRRWKVTRGYGSGIMRVCPLGAVGWEPLAGTHRLSCPPHMPSVTIFVQEVQLQGPPAALGGFKGAYGLSRSSIIGVNTGGLPWAGHGRAAKSRHLTPGRYYIHVVQCHVNWINFLDIMSTS